MTVHCSKSQNDNMPPVACVVMVMLALFSLFFCSCLPILLHVRARLPYSLALSFVRSPAPSERASNWVEGYRFGIQFSGAEIFENIPHSSPPTAQACIDFVLKDGCIWEEVETEPN